MQCCPSSQRPVEMCRSCINSAQILGCALKVKLNEYIHVINIQTCHRINNHQLILSGVQCLSCFCCVYLYIHKYIRHLFCQGDSQIICASGTNFN